MKVLAPTLAIALQAMSFAPPPWLPPASVARLHDLHIDFQSDLVERGNYHWEWRAPKPFRAGAFSCPAGAGVSISRSMMLVSAPPPSTPCRDEKGRAAPFVKLLEDGGAGPLGG